MYAITMQGLSENSVGGWHISITRHTGNPGRLIEGRPRRKLGCGPGRIKREDRRNQKEAVLPWITRKLFGVRLGLYLV